MNKIGHRATALLLCVVLLFGLSISAGARESQCIDHYNVKASALGNGKISIEVALSGTEPMQEIGAKMIVVNEKQADGNYKAVYTFTPEKYTNLIKKNGRTFSFKGTYQGIAGKQYYITAQLYAKNASLTKNLSKNFDFGGNNSKFLDMYSWKGQKGKSSPAGAQ